MPTQELEYGDMCDAAVTAQGLESIELAGLDPIDDSGRHDAEEFGELIRRV
jgi:hypothetical protein